MDKLALRTNGTLYGYKNGEVVYKKDLLIPELQSLLKENEITVDTPLETAFTEVRVGQWAIDELKTNNS